LFAGRKLLVADDSPYYQAVLGLTFTDEGMAVNKTGDGQDALARIEQTIPDVILASVSLPGIGGYELCERIKQNERFGHIPVMLLVGLHEPFDQTEARRVGADDVVTKPFKSIRQLVNRVGSLLSGKPADTDDTSGGHSTLGLERSEPVQAPEHQIANDTNLTGGIEAPLMSEHESLEPKVASAEIASEADIERQTADTQRFEIPSALPAAAPDADVKVFVEAASMTDYQPAESEVEAAGSTCAADVELQTANTQELERIGDEPHEETIEPIAYAQDDTIEMAPAIAAGEKSEPPDVKANQNLSSLGTSEMSEETNGRSASLHSQAIFNDALLDLGGFDNPTPQLVADDLVLDLDYDEVATFAVVAVPEMVESAQAFAPAEVTAPEPAYEKPHVIEIEEQAIVAEGPAAEMMTASVVAEPGSTEPNLGLSPETIDAIARRVVEHLSDKVVREIAWEVVPELAELLIKKKLQEQG